MGETVSLSGTEQQRLVVWRQAPESAGRLVAYLPKDCFASIDLRDDGSHYVLIGCNAENPILISDIFDDRDVAQAWVEDKARLLVRGINIASHQRSG